MESSSLTEEDIRNAVSKKLKAYENLSALEQYAFFMGKAQILEFGLKSLLARKYSIPLDSTEKLTMGQTKNKLSEFGLRTDFIAYLDSVVKHRNYIAHEFLLNTALTQSIANFSDRKIYGDLFRAAYELEQIIIFYNWCEENNGW